jgi:hypothetical protein
MSMTPNSPSRVRAALRRQQATELRAAGNSYKAIAAQVGVSVRRVRQYLDKTMRALHEKAVRDVEVVIGLELQRLDELHRALWTRAVTGDVKAALAILKIGERRSRLLGLDAPTRLKLTEEDHRSPEEVRAEALRMGISVAPLEDLEPVTYPPAPPSLSAPLDYVPGVTERRPGLN